MNKNDHFFRFGMVGTMLLLMAFAFSGFAQPDINNSTWSGWTDRGSSYATGVYASGTKSSDYQIYTTVFILTMQTRCPHRDPRHHGMVLLRGIGSWELESEITAEPPLRLLLILPQIITVFIPLLTE